MVEKVRWRGTPGVGDFMMALNVCHNYAHRFNCRINLEMHWEHGEGYLHHPDDPETIVERMEWIHSRYHRSEDVSISHCYNSDLFEHGAFNPNKQKRRFYFDSGAFDDPSFQPDADWVFKKSEFITPKPKKLVIWTPQHNKEPPRSWKRFLTFEDWSSIIEMFRREEWNIVELSYRTPIRDAYRQVQSAELVICYDGMWHYIARNFAKPIAIPSWEGITTYHTPQVVKRSSREKFLKFIKGGKKGIEDPIRVMKDKSASYKKELVKYHEDR